MRKNIFIEKYRPWAQDFPGANEGCGCLDQRGKLESATYEEAKFYACERPLGAPAICDQGWEHYGKSCYMVTKHFEWKLSLQKSF